jgi:hypothetical protein
MAKDDDLLSDDQPAENLLPEEQGLGSPAAPAAEPEAAPAKAEPATAEPPSPVAAELNTKPGNNVWTMLILISILAMIAGIWIQASELNEIYKINVIPGGGSKQEEPPPPPPPDDDKKPGPVEPNATNPAPTDKPGGDATVPPKEK